MEDTEDEYDDDVQSVASSVALSKKDILDTIKPSKVYIFARGMFGPSGAAARRRSKMDTLLGPTPGRKKRKKETKEKQPVVEPTARQRRHTKKIKPLNEFVVLSEEEGEEGEEEEEWEGIDEEEAFLDLKSARFATMEEEQVTPYFNVQRKNYTNLRAYVLV